MARRRKKHHFSREGIKTWTLRDIVTVLTILGMIGTMAGGAGWMIKTPGTAKAEKLEFKTDAHIDEDLRIHTDQDKRITTLETDFKQFLTQWQKDITDLKTGQDRVATALEQMASSE